MAGRLVPRRIELAAQEIVGEGRERVIGRVFPTVIKTKNA
jgi:hypothetical protein